jgi:hypothetical protein
MMAFDTVFLDVAKRESRAIQTVDAAGTPATFVFRELYCDEPGCDCRRVLLHVHWVEGKCIAASISYAFERPRRRDEKQISLDPLNPQSERSRDLLALFTEMIEEDGAYRAGLIRHYEMWKQVIDRASHPDRGKAHEGPSRRPAAPRRNAQAPGRRPAGRRERGPEPGPGTAGAAAGAGSLELVAAKGARADSKLQQRFRRVLQKVDRLRQQVRTWKEGRPGIDAEISAWAALCERRDKLGRDMIGLLDRSYANPIFSKAERKKLAGLIASMAGDLIEGGGHDDLKPLYNRYGRGDFDAEAAAADAEGAEALRSIMEQLGVEFGDADVGSMDKLQAFTEAQLQGFEQEAAAEEERRARRKKSKKQLAAEARRESERRSIGKALQDVYRELARALHPDREQDPAERARKTAVMQEVNVAYEAKDLLRLLELQLEIERVEPERADAIAEERLQHYIRILDEQARQLAVELDELELPFRMELGTSISARLAPADIVARIRADAEEAKRRIAVIAHDLEAFEEAPRLKAWLKTQARPRAGGGEPGRDLFG